jgi:hypothetical protein
MAFGTMDSRRDATAYTDHGVVILADHVTWKLQEAYFLQCIVSIQLGVVR